MASTTLKRSLRPSPNRFTHTPIPIPIPTPTHTSRLLRKAMFWLLVATAVLLSHTPTAPFRIFLSISNKISSTYKLPPQVFFVLPFLRCKCITSLIRMLMPGATVLISPSMKVISTQTLRMDPALGSCVVYTHLTFMYTFWAIYCAAFDGVHAKRLMTQARREELQSSSLQSSRLLGSSPSMCITAQRP